MNDAQAFVSLLVKLGLMAVLVGTLVRRRHRECLAFPVYLALVLACDSLVSAMPERFYQAWFWYLQQSLWDAAKLAIALEIAFRTFRSFPGARPKVQALLALVLAVTTAAVISLPPGLSHDAVVFEWQPPVLTGTIWLMTALMMVVVYYRLPMRPFPLAILSGFVTYLLLFVTLLNVLRHHGWSVRHWVNLADAWCYLALVVFWGVAAWRRDALLQGLPFVVKRLNLGPA
jgi:hypothetical protein